MTEASIATKPVRNAAIARPAPNYRAIRIWLWSVAAVVFAMVILGGTTRLTDSGLSITEWNPISGVLPPLNHADWLAEFAKYKQIPQYKDLFSNMDLNRFKFIFMWEWSHRLLGRFMIGIVFIIPFAVFWLRDMLPTGMKAKLLGVLALLGLQAFVGWWMVKSGLVGRVEVAQQWLALHLFLASLTIAALVYLAASLKPAVGETLPAAPRLRRLATLTICVVFVQIVLGALVAGLRAGRAFNTWPLMDGHFIPSTHLLFAMESFWRNFTDNIAMVQFQHRMGGYTLLALTLLQALCVAAWAPKSRAKRRAFHLFGIVFVQACLGIVTLLLVVPLWAGLIHQAFAMFVLAKMVIYRESLSRARSQPTLQVVASA